MTKEEIKNKADDYLVKTRISTSMLDPLRDIQLRKGFTAGAEWAAGEMDKEACEFAEWVDKYASQVADGLWLPLDLSKDDNTHSTSELYQIFKQQKP